MSQTSTRPPRKSVVGRPRFGPYLLAGALGGLIAGAAFMALTAWFATSTGAPRLSPLRTVATIAQGTGRAGGGDVWVGIAVHVVISIVFGLIFALVTAAFRSATLVALAGLVYGAAIYVVDFQVLPDQVTRLVAFKQANQPFEAATHLVFGGLLAVLILLGARRDRGLQPVASAERTGGSAADTGTGTGTGAGADTSGGYAGPAAGGRSDAHERGRTDTGTSQGTSTDTTAWERASDRASEDTRSTRAR